MSLIAMGGQKVSPNPTLMREMPQVYTPMGITAEHVANRFGVSREEQDAFALRSHQRAAKAVDSGTFADEIVSMPTRVYGKTGWQDVKFKLDEGPRRDTSLAALAKLRPVFAVKGSVTAGNSSQMSDGAAATLLCERGLAEKLNLPVLGLLRSYHVVGVPPEIMGVGPKEAIPGAVKAAGLKLADIDLFEINEAFASQAIYCVRELGIELERVNVHGGAIALGHPLGCTGARLTATLLYEMRRQQKRYGVVSMCIGGGMGAAAVFENPEAS